MVTWSWCHPAGLTLSSFVPQSRKGRGFYFCRAAGRDAPFPATLPHTSTSTSTVTSTAQDYTHNNRPRTHLQVWTSPLSSALTFIIIIIVMCLGYLPLFSPLTSPSSDFLPSFPCILLSPVVPPLFILTSRPSFPLLSHTSYMTS